MVTTIIRCIDGVNHTESDYVSLTHRAQMLSPNCSLELNITMISVHPHVYILTFLTLILASVKSQSNRADSSNLY